jgi:hypothetical protein
MASLREGEGEEDDDGDGWSRREAYIEVGSDSSGEVGSLDV